MISSSPAGMFYYDLVRCHSLHMFSDVQLYIFFPKYEFSGYFSLVKSNGEGHNRAAPYVII